ncbi:hypothetical protein DN412_17060 [Cupriavidus lacunae]|uniref:Uncharacterized protein n=1 Tax=Cupriavidus lacunae TaxID=2666307 RepID=A0A370NU66_9BURK|nr:hypothetical protein DN412_17060 [Cupriavidus lacunae]
MQEFIDAFFNGKAKTLSDIVAKRLRGTTIPIPPAVRGELLRCVQEVDPVLDKTRKLMQLALENRALKTVGDILMEFCAECVLLNPAVHSNGMKALLFPGYADSTRLEDAWQGLMSLPPLSQVSNRNVTSPEEEPDAARQTPGTPGANGGARDKRKGKSDRTGPVKGLAASARRNALLCSAVWRLYHSHCTFPEMMRGLRATVFALSKRPQSLETELITAITTLSEKEDERFAYLLEWSNRLQTDSLNKLNNALRLTEELQSHITAIEQQLQSSVEHADKLESQLSEERAARAASDEALGVVKTHGQADFEELRATSLKAIRDAVAQLDVVSEALKRDVPKVESARDKIDAVMDALKVTNKKLENA